MVTPLLGDERQAITKLSETGIGSSADLICNPYSPVLAGCLSVSEHGVGDGKLKVSIEC